MLVRRASLLLLLELGCGPLGGGGENCQEDLDASVPRCCDPQSFALISIPELLGNPSRYLSTQIETVGLADWFTDPNNNNQCTCGGGACACIVPLALRSQQCGERVRLIGDYQGSPVQCDGSGCWPIQPPLEHSVCGTLIYDADLSVQPEGGYALRLQQFCAR